MCVCVCEYTYTYTYTKVKRIVKIEVKWGYLFKTKEKRIGLLLIILKKVRISLQFRIDHNIIQSYKFSEKSCVRSLCKMSLNLVTWLVNPFTGLKRTPQWFRDLVYRKEFVRINRKLNILVLDLNLFRRYL